MTYSQRQIQDSRKKRRRAALRWLKHDGEMADPGDYIESFETAVKEGDRVLLFCRVSTPQQKGHLDDQESVLRAACDRVGAKVVGVIRRVMLGCARTIDPLHRRDWDWEVTKAARKATRRRAKLLATEPDRFVRNPFYSVKHIERARLQARPIDFQTLKNLAGDVELVTLMNPSLGAAEANSRQSTRGQQSNSRFGGRPPSLGPGYKKKRRLRHRDTAIFLHKSGLSIRQISKKLGVARSTVHSWLSPCHD